MEAYKYNKSISRFYDAVYESILDKSGYNFYLNEISNANGPVLEIGAGTGRIFVPSLQNGADIYGIDQSENMLSVLKTKISGKDYERLSLQDSRDFKLERKFNLIIAPFRMFSHLLTVEDQLKTLDRIYEHLEPGGRFIFDVFVPNYSRLTKAVNDLLEFDGEYEPGKKLQRIVTNRYDHINQILFLTFKFVWDENGKSNIEECHFPLRYFFRYELENLIGRSKLKLNKIYDGFKGKELSNETTDFVIESGC